MGRRGHNKVFHPLSSAEASRSATYAASGCILQVYRARVAATGQEVAVKVQRPNALATISKVGGREDE